MKAMKAGLRCAVIALLALTAAGIRAQSSGTGVPVHYQLPTTGPLPQTYRVTLAITDPQNPKWIVSTFVAGAVRTVTTQNQGKFTETWDGLDDNNMPLPPGSYGVKGIYMPASLWSIDQQYHTMIPKLAVAAGDSWAPTPDRDTLFPAIFGHVFGHMADVQASSNGMAGFLSNYIENCYNPFLVDLTKPIGPDQVVKKYASGGRAGGGTVACDGSLIWGVSWDGNDAGKLIFRSDSAWGTDTNQFGVKGRLMPVPVPGLVAWNDDAHSRKLLYAAQPAPVNTIVALDGNTSATLTMLPFCNPQSLIMDQTAPGQRLLALHTDASGHAKVAVISLANGLPTSTSDLFTLTGVTAPGALATDSQGCLYVSDTASGLVFKLSRAGALLGRYGGGAAGKMNSLNLPGSSVNSGNTPGGQSAGNTPGGQSVGITHPAVPGNGPYDDHVFYSPTKMTTWTDAQGNDHLLVVENGGPGRVSEWTPQGDLTRQWFLSQSVNLGYGVDPRQPQYLYAVSNGTNGLIRFKVDYSSGQWSVDSFWPNICRNDGQFPGGRQTPKIINLAGNKYLAFADGVIGGGNTMIYRQSGPDWIPSAGIITEGTQSYWWHDANGDGLPEPAEYRSTPTAPFFSYWGNQFLNDLTLVERNNKTNRDYSFQAPTGFDTFGNPIYSGVWQHLLTDPVFAAKAQGVALSALYGGNEISTGWSDWAWIDGSLAGDFYVADSSGPGNPGGIDNAGSHYSQFKLSRYSRDASGAYAAQWRVGRKAWRLANPGEVYATQRVTAPINGIVGVFDSNGLYELYTTDGLYVDTLMNDSFLYGKAAGGMYSMGGETWNGQHFLNNQNGNVYLLMGRASANAYEISGWTNTDNSVRPISCIDQRVSITAGQIAPANSFALVPRGNSGAANVAMFYPAAGGAPALNGSTLGWESATPSSFGLDANHHVDAQGMYDVNNVYLRWHVRLPTPFVARDIEDATRIFTHERQADTVSFYLQGDPNAQPSALNPRLGDARIVFAIVKDGTQTRPIAVGMYPQWPGPGAGTPQTYVSPAGSAPFANVGLLNDVTLGYAIDSDQKGFVIAAALPKSRLPRLPDLTNGVKTLVDFAATFDGISNVWWANAEGLSITNTSDEPSEARLYPGAWAQAQFIPLGTAVPVRTWLASSIWGAPALQSLQGDNTASKTAAIQIFEAAAYPPDKGNVDLSAVYSGPLSLDRNGKQQTAKWSQMPIGLDGAVHPAGSYQAAFAAAWIYSPAAVSVGVSFLSPKMGGHRVWINGQPVTACFNTWQPKAIIPVAQQTIALHAGWNTVFMRSYSYGYDVMLGMTLNGSSSLLWTLKTTSTPPH